MLPAFNAINQMKKSSKEYKKIKDLLSDCCTLNVLPKQVSKWTSELKVTWVTDITYIAHAHMHTRILVTRLWKSGTF